MFCINCGCELSENAKFCMKCGARVAAPEMPEEAAGDQSWENGQQGMDEAADEMESTVDGTPEEEDDLAGMTIKKEKIGNKVSTALARKTVNKDLQSYQVEPEDIVKMIRKYIIPQYADDPKGMKKLESVVLGKGVMAANRVMESKDGRWRIVTYYIGKAGSKASLDITNSSYIYLTDREKNIRYQYGAFTMGKFKKAAKDLFR